ncbi:MAG TPA: magnesium transporter [Ferruginibacter sp.]|nr:magnesium transporter [Ferruginibacter sp.]
MISLKDIRKKILSGDFSSLLHWGSNDNIHPSEVAKLFNDLPLDAALRAFNSFPQKKQVIVFSYLELSLQKKIIRSTNKENASFILNKLSSDDRLTLINSFKVGVERSHILELLEDKNKKSTHDMLGYPTKSVARLVNTEFATISEHMTVAEASEHLRKNHVDSETANVIYVIDSNGKLIDDIPVRRLVLNAPDKHVSEIMDGYCVQLNLNDSADDAVSKFQEYDRTVLPVTNDDNLLLGVVTVDDVMDVQEQRDTRDMQRFGGVDSLDYPYVNTPFFSLIRKRAGWLIILFLGEMLTATAMGYFEVEISKAVMLALFIPLIISSGGNCGSQAATLIIRAMAVKELSIKDWWYVMRREILSGLTLGIILGAIGFVRIAAWQKLHLYNYGVHWMLLSITIFFSLIGIVMWGTLCGSMIPIILKKCKQDPAASSAPFVATLVDVTGLVIYFSIAALILKGTLL